VRRTFSFRMGGHAAALLASTPLRPLRGACGAGGAGGALGVGLVELCVQRVEALRDRAGLEPLRLEQTLERRYLVASRAHLGPGRLPLPFKAQFSGLGSLELGLELVQEALRIRQLKLQVRDLLAPPELEVGEGHGGRVLGLLGGGEAAAERVGGEAV